MSLQTVLLLIIIGLLAGVLSGFVGVGGGIILVPALVLLVGLTQYEAQGTSLALLMTPVGIFAVYNYYQAGHIKINFALLIAVGFVVGAYFGSKLSLRLENEDLVKKIFAGFMILVAAKMLFSK